MSDLPDEMLAAVLAKVPFSRSKVAAQCVCKKWEEVLQTSAAHSLDTLEEDSYVDFDSNLTPEVSYRGNFQTTCFQNVL